MGKKPYYYIIPSSGETCAAPGIKLKSSGRYVILAVMPGAGHVSPAEGIIETEAIYKVIYKR